MNDVKKCSQCGKILPLDSFCKNKRKQDGFNNICKQCACENNRKYREKKKRENLDDVRKKYREQAVVKKQKRELLIDSLKKPCAKCGESRYWVLDFHHIDPKKKEFGIGQTKGVFINKDKLINEINKCVCLCRNCHQEFHHFYGQNPDNPVEALEEYLRGDVIYE